MLCYLIAQIFQTWNSAVFYLLSFAVHYFSHWRVAFIGGSCFSDIRTYIEWYFTLGSDVIIFLSYIFRVIYYNFVILSASDHILSNFGHSSVVLECSSCREEGIACGMKQYWSSHQRDALVVRDARDPFSLLYP